MGLTYTRLFHLLLDRNIKKGELQEMAGVTASIMARLGKNETVKSDTIEKICCALNCQPGDIMEYVPADTAQAPEMPHAAAGTQKADKSPSRAETTPHTSGHVHKGRYNQFTAMDEKEIDTKRLLTDPRYQQEISDTFGGDMLLFLVDKDRMQQGGGSV